jgi:hypothetical protein
LEVSNWRSWRAQRVSASSVPRLKASEDALVGLPRKIAVAGLAEGGAGAGGSHVEELIEAVPADHEQSVGGAGAGDREAAEGGVEVVKLVGARQGVDRDGDGVGLSLPGVDGGGNEDTVGQVVLGGESFDHRGGVVDGLVAGGEDDEEWVAVRVARGDADLVEGGAEAVVPAADRGEACFEEGVEEILDDAQ